MKNERQIEIMGIVNLTDDSYFADSRCSDVSAAISRIETLVEEGADIIDIGACSTRPGSVPVGAEEEWHRLEPVMKILGRDVPHMRLSVDTYWSEVVEKAYDVVGDFIVNDISAGEDDPQMLPVVGRLGLEYVAMHKRGSSQTMQTLVDYDDVTEDVKAYFITFADKASRYGVKNWILDPGFGFAKTVEQNYALLRNLSVLRDQYSGYNPKVLVGVSRKSMVYKPLGISPEDALPATQAVHMAALCSGADMLRVHDVAAALQTVTLYKLLKSSQF